MGATVSLQGLQPVATSHMPQPRCGVGGAGSDPGGDHPATQQSEVRDLGQDSGHTLGAATWNHGDSPQGPTVTGCRGSASPGQTGSCQCGDRHCPGRGAAVAQEAPQRSTEGIKVSSNHGPDQGGLKPACPPGGRSAAPVTFMS